MKSSNLKKEIRLGVVNLLAIIGIIIVSSDPAADSTWLTTFVISKLIGLGFFGLSFYLVKVWKPKGLLPDILNENGEDGRSK